MEVNCKTGEKPVKIDDNEANNDTTSSTKAENLKKEEKLINNLRTQIPDIDNIFNIHRKIGQGTFSTVFLVSLKCNEHILIEKRKFFALKHIIPTSHPSRIERELKCLLQIGGSNNVVGVDLCLRKHESVAFVMPYIPHDHFHDYFDKMSASETQIYMKNLLIALKRVHSYNIIHRDVKPSNFLYNRKLQKFLLVDFGLAEDISLRIGEPSNKPSSSALGASSSSKNVQENLDEHKKRRRSDAECSSLDNSEAKKAKTENMENNKSVASPRSSASTLESPFKTPLKQNNQIIPQMRTHYSPYRSALETQVKSAVMGLSMSKLIHKNGKPAAYNTDRKGTETEKASSVCQCFQKATVCNICLVRKEIKASRAGTPGYRPPEVLLKYPEQTTVVDIWAVGVIFITILSKCYPFFTNSDDFTSLAEIVTVFGDQRIKKTAYHLGRYVKIGHKKQPLDIRKLCLRLRNRANPKQTTAEAVGTKGTSNECENCQQKNEGCLCEATATNRDFSTDAYTDNAYDLLMKLLEINPKSRISAEDALRHPFFQETFDN